MYSLVCILLTLSYCQFANSQNVNLNFDQSYFDINETVIVSCEPAHTLTLQWHNISQLTLVNPSSSNVLFTLTRDCNTNLVNVTTLDSRINHTDDFELQWHLLDKQDAATYVCSLVECEKTTTHSSANTSLTFLDLVEPTLQSPNNNSYVMSDKQSLEVVCQVSKAALVDGDQLLIEHVFNGKVSKTVTAGSSTGNTLINASYSFTPNNETKRVTNYFYCSNVNENRPDINLTKHALTVHVEYQPTTLYFNGAELERANDDGTEFKVDLKNTSLKVQCVTDGYPAPTYKVRQMSGPTDAVFIKNNEIDIEYETMPVTDYHLRFRCDAEYNSNTGLAVTTKTGYLNVYTSSSCRNEPALLATVVAVLIMARKLTFQ